MADCLLRVHLQSPVGPWAWMTLSYNNMILYLVCQRDVTKAEFQQLAEQLKPWGSPCIYVPPGGEGSTRFLHGTRLWS